MNFSYFFFVWLLPFSSFIKITNFLHEMITWIIKLNVSLIVTNILLVHLLFSILSYFFILKNYQSRTSSLSIKFFNENISFRKLSKSIKESNDFIMSNLPWETSHNKASILVICWNVIWKFDDISLCSTIAASVSSNNLK